jgi:hypothetical protein
MPDYPLDPFDTAHWLDHPAPAEPEEGSQEVKVPNLWARPAGPTPGQTYAAYGDTGAMSGQTEGLSPAMKQMIRRNLGRRLSEQTMGERQQTAEQAMRGAGYVAPNPLVAAATSGVTSQFMGDTPGQTAARVASSLIPLAGGQAVRAGLQYAPRLTAGALTAGAAMLPDATESTAADTDPNPFKWDDAAAAQRRKMAERTASGMRDRAAAKYLTEFQAREDVQRADVQKKSADWIAAQSAAAKTGDALSAFKTSVAPSAGVLKSRTPPALKKPRKSTARRCPSMSAKAARLPKTIPVFSVWKVCK